MRQRINREKRRASGERKEELWEMYKAQKEKVKKMVRRQEGEYEKRTAKEVKENRSQEKMWKMIKKLRGDSELKSEE